MRLPEHWRLASSRRSGWSTGPPSACTRSYAKRQCARHCLPAVRKRRSSSTAPAHSAPSAPAPCSSADAGSSSTRRSSAAATAAHGADSHGFNPSFRVARRVCRYACFHAQSGAHPCTIGTACCHTPAKRAWSCAGHGQNRQQPWQPCHGAACEHQPVDIVSQAAGPCPGANPIVLHGRWSKHQ